MPSNHARSLPADCQARSLYRQGDILPSVPPNTVREPGAGSIDFPESPPHGVGHNDFLFVDQNDEASKGFVTSEHRRIIRSHVMQRYRNRGGKTSRAERTKAPLDRSITDYMSSITNKKSIVSRVSERLSYTTTRAPADGRMGASTNTLERVWNSAVNDFAYGGVSPLDVQSYGFFNHYYTQCTLRASA